jgi:hypothetical protein
VCFSLNARKDDATVPQIFSEEALNFSDGALEESFEKVVDGTLPCGLFPSKRWKVTFFRASDGNRKPVRIPLYLRNEMSTKEPKTLGKL